MARQRDLIVGAAVPLIMSSSNDVQKKIDELEAEMARTQKNKATNYHLGTLKAKIAKLKSELVNGPGGKSAGTKNAERGFDVTKSGDTRIGLVGFPSVGKSTLLTTLTGTRSEAAAYEFTTLTCIPGTMKYKGARIQVLDLPGIIEGAADGRGRGRQVISTARTCNMILVSYIRNVRKEKLLIEHLHVDACIVKAANDHFCQCLLCKAQKDHFYRCSRCEAQ